MADIQRIGEHPPKGAGVRYYCHDCKKFVKNYAHKCGDINSEVIE